MGIGTEIDKHLFAVLRAPSGTRWRGNYYVMTCTLVRSRSQYQSCLNVLDVLHMYVYEVSCMSISTNVAL